MTWLLSVVLAMLIPVQAPQTPPRPKLDAPNQQQAPDILPPGQPQVVTPLAFDGKNFITSFNAAADRARIVTVLSPT